MKEKPQQNSQPQIETGLSPIESNPLSEEQNIPIEINPLSKEPEPEELKSGYGRSQLPPRTSSTETEVPIEDNLEADGEEKPTCQHHWIIESPHGPISLGECINCGEKREFRNSADDGLWENDSGSPRRFPN